jgi:hypothetical protein
MPRRSSLGNVTQIRKEVTVGVDPTTGTKIMKSMAVMPTPAADVNLFRAASGLFPSVAALGREWSAGAMADSPPLYDEVIYPLSSIIQAAVITTPGGGTLSRIWTFTMPTTGGVTPVSYTVEYGETAGAEKIVGYIVNDYHINTTRQALVAGGNGFGQIWTPGITLTGSPTALPNVPILPSTVDVFVDSTFGGLGTTKLTADFVANLNITNRWGQIWPINSAKTSWDDVTETEPTVTLDLSVENNAAGQAFITKMRASTLSYVRVKATSAAFIETTIPWSLQYDFVGMVSAAPGTGDQNGLYVLTVQLRAFSNGTNPPLTIAVTNTQTTLT